MLIDDLLAVLQRVKAEHGNIAVYGDDFRDEGESNTTPETLTIMFEEVFGKKILVFGVVDSYKNVEYLQEKSNDT